MNRYLAFIFVLIALSTASISSRANPIFKCVNSDGKTVWQGHVCGTDMIGKEVKQAPGIRVVPKAEMPAPPSASYGDAADTRSEHRKYLDMLEADRTQEQARRQQQSAVQYPRSSQQDLGSEIEAAQRACTQEQRSQLRDRKGTPSCKRAEELMERERLHLESLTSRETGQPMPDHTTVEQHYHYGNRAPSSAVPPPPQRVFDAHNGRWCTVFGNGAPMQCD